MTNYIFGTGCVLRLNIALDDKEEVVRAGSELRGRVIVEVEKGSIGGEVELTIRGKEKSTRKKGPVDLCHHHEFFSNTIKLRDPNRKVLGPGELILPFALELPECLPSASLHRIGLDSVGFNVQYKLTAKLGNNTKSIPIGLAAAPLKCGNSSFVVHPTQQTIFSMRGSNQGSLTMAASIQNTNIRKGEKARVAVACRNDSLVKIQRVEAKVVELLNWGSKEGYTKTRVNKDSLVKLDNIDLPGVQKENHHNTSIVDSNYRTVNEQKAVCTSIQNDLVSGLNEIEMEVPMRAKDSYPGTLVDIRHYLKITFITRNPLFGAQPSIKIPLKIGLPEEIPRVYAFADKSSEVEKVALPNLSRTNQTILPVASAVPITTHETNNVQTVGYNDQVSKGTYGDHISKDFDQMPREVEPVPVRKALKQRVAIAENGPGGKSSDVQLSLHDLVPMVPSS